MEKLNAYRTAQMKCALAVIDAYLANVPEVVKLVKSFDGKSFNGRMNSALRNISCALDKNTDDAHGNLKIISISFQPWPIIEKYSSECRTLISLEDMKPLNYLRFFINKKTEENFDMSFKDRSAFLKNNRIIADNWITAIEKNEAYWKKQRELLAREAEDPSTVAETLHAYKAAVFSAFHMCDGFSDVTQALFHNEIMSVRQ